MSNDTNWLERLREAVAESSGNQVARRLGVSPATISLLVNEKYKGDMTAMEERVRGALIGETVDCPVLGEIGRDACLTWQRAKFIASNPTRIKLYRACRGGCPNSKSGGGEK
jgi:hypothetical protein